MEGQRNHGELLRYTVPGANGKQSANVGTEWFCVNNLKRQLIVRNVIKSVVRGVGAKFFWNV